MADCWVVSPPDDAAWLVCRVPLSLHAICSIGVCDAQPACRASFTRAVHPSPQAAVPLVYIPLEAVVSKWYGESEKMLAGEQAADTYLLVLQLRAFYT